MTKPWVFGGLGRGPRSCRQTPPAAGRDGRDERVIDRPPMPWTRRGGGTHSQSKQTEDVGDDGGEPSANADDWKQVVPQSPGGAVGATLRGPEPQRTLTAVGGSRPGFAAEQGAQRQEEADPPYKRWWRQRVESWEVKPHAFSREIGAQGVKGDRTGESSKAALEGCGREWNLRCRGLQQVLGNTRCARRRRGIPRPGTPPSALFEPSTEEVSAKAKRASDQVRQMVKLVAGGQNQRITADVVL